MDHNHPGPPPGRKPTPVPVVSSAPPELDKRIRHLEDKLRLHQETKEECARLKSENERVRQELDKARHELRLLKVPPREGSRCGVCGMTVTKAGSPRMASVSSAALVGVPTVSVPSTRTTRTQSVADDKDTSPRKKQLPVAPPSDDEDESKGTQAAPPQPAQRQPYQAAELNPAEIKKQVVTRYGAGVDLRGTRRTELPPEPDESDESEDSDAPEPPPKPGGRQSLSGLPDAIEIPASSSPVSAMPIPISRGSNTNTLGRKSPRYMSDPGKASIPTAIAASAEGRDSRGSGISSSGSDSPDDKDSQRPVSAAPALPSGAAPGTTHVNGAGVATRDSRKASISSSGSGSVSRATGLGFSNVFRRNTSSSIDVDNNYDTTDTDITVSPDGGTPSGRSHSLMDPNESLRWRRLAIGEGGARSVTLTPINVTTINKTTYYLVRVESPDSSWVVPRTYEQFRDFRQNLLFEFPTATVPQPPSKIFKNVKEKTVGDRLAWLQTFLDSLLADSQLAGSVLLLKFLDPFYRPSPLALRAIAPIKEGTLQYRSEKTAGKALRPMLCVLKHDLYVFRSQEDQGPFEVVALDYCTIDLVAESAEVPRFAFHIVSLKEGDTFLFAAASSKELADWLLNIREEKTKRVSFNQGEHPAVFPLVEELEKRREESLKLLTDYAMDRSDEKTIAAQVADATTIALPVVKPEPEAGLSVDVKGGILAATQPKLLHVAFDTRRSDKAFVPVFLVAFRYFTSPLEVFAYLRDKYTGGSGDARARSMTVLERWVALHLYDFLDSLPLAKLLVDLLVLRLARADAADVKAALRSALRSAGGPVDGATSAFPPAVMPQIFRGTSFDVLDLAPLELARQVSLVQHGMFAKIDARELLQDAWTGPDGATKAPHVNAFIANFNQLCGWISSVIVSTRPMIPRIALIHRFIDVAKCCLELQNYNGAMAILGALLSNPVHRLKEDWEAVPRDSQDIFAEVRALFATTGNFKAYRAAIAAAVPPAVPYLGLALQDLTFFETNKDTKVIATMTMVNLEKADRISAVLQELRKFQVVPYVLRPMPTVQSYLLRGAVLSADEQDARSYTIRPKTAATDGSGGSSPRRVVWKKEYGSPRRETPE